jgi:pyruvate dehydrogenase E2 component (dihydrolipoamide acetyltransferase)
MITKIIMPQLSLTMQSGLVAYWYKNEGDYVKKGEPVCSIEGDKATVDVEAPVSGYLKKIIAITGEEFPVKQPIAYLGEQEDVYLNNDVVSPKKMENYPTSISIPSEPIEKKESGRISISPVARRMAAENNIDIGTIVGSGPDGMINREDVQKVIDTNQRNPTGDLSIQSRIKLSGIQKIVADRMKTSYNDAPHIHLSLHVSMTNVLEGKKKFETQDNNSAHVSLTDIFAWAVSRVLSKDLRLNSTLINDEIVLYSDINLGVAVSADTGLSVAVIRNADKLGLIEIAQKREILVNKIKNNVQTQEDINGGTFTITNLGMFEVEEFDPILIPGQAGILAVGKVIDIVQQNQEGKFSIQPMVKLTLACDHRIVNGIDGARFLSTLKSILENPSEIFA